MEKLVEKLVYDDLNIQQLNKDYSLKTWNAPPERFNRSAALHHVQTINPRNDRPKTNLTNNWLSEVNHYYFSPEYITDEYPRSTPIFRVLQMHSYNDICMSMKFILQMTFNG